MCYLNMMSTVTAGTMNTLFYTYAASVVVAIVFMFAALYTLRDLLGGFALAALVYYLYNM